MSKSAVPTEDLSSRIDDYVVTMEDTEDRQQQERLYADTELEVTGGEKSQLQVSGFAINCGRKPNCESD